MSRVVWWASPGYGAAIQNLAPAPVRKHQDGLGENDARTIAVPRKYSIH